jgi:hypothetical protein
MSGRLSSAADINPVASCRACDAMRASAKKIHACAPAPDLERSIATGT